MSPVSTSLRYFSLCVGLAIAGCSTAPERNADTSTRVAPQICYAPDAPENAESRKNRDTSDLSFEYRKY